MRNSMNTSTVSVSFLLDGTSFALPTSEYKEVLASYPDYEAKGGTGGWTKNLIAQYEGRRNTVVSGKRSCEDQYSTELPYDIPTEFITMVMG